MNIFSAFDTSVMVALLLGIEFLGVISERFSVAKGMIHSS